VFSLMIRLGNEEEQDYFQPCLHGNGYDSATADYITWFGFMKKIATLKEKEASR